MTQSALCGQTTLKENGVLNCYKIDMKMKNLVPRAILCSILTLGATSAFAAQSENLDVRGALRSVVLPEMPVKAAVLVSQAQVSQRLVIALSVVQEANALNPASLVSVVSEICKAEPRVAGDVAVLAASLQPKNLAAITHAAIKSVPEKHNQIVMALSKAYPTELSKMAGAAQLALPAEQRIDVFTSMTEALPGLKSVIDVKNMDILRQMFANGGTTINVSVVEAALSVVASQATLIRNALIQSLVSSGIDLSIAQEVFSFQAVANKILNQTIPIGETGGNDNSAAIETAVAGAFTSEIANATTQQVIKDNPEAGATEREALVAAKIDTTTSAVTNADTGSKVTTNVTFQQTKTTAGQSTSIVTTANSVTLTESDLRTYSKVN